MFMLAVVHIGADFFYVGVSSQIRNEVVMQCDIYLVCMRLMTVKIFSAEFKLCMYSKCYEQTQCIKF